jgi:hypothetical protein
MNTLANICFYISVSWMMIAISYYFWLRVFLNVSHNDASDLTNERFNKI